MNFEFSAQQKESKLAVLKFVEQHYSFSERQSELKSDADKPSKAWDKLRLENWVAALFNPAHGGAGGTAKDRMAIMEGCGQGLLIEPLIGSYILCGDLISSACSASVRDNLLPSLMSGDTVFAAALYEPNSRYNLAHVETRAEMRRLGVMLNGHKSLVLNGGIADKLIVSARVGGAAESQGGISLFLIDPDAKGVTVTPYRTIDGQPAADVMLQDVFIDKRDAFGVGSEALPYIQQAVDQATLAVCGQALGSMQELNQMTLEYTKNREQFGVPISQFQILQHKMADMLVEYQQARSAVLLAVLVADENQGEAAAEISAAKYRVGVAAKTIARDAVQLHGALGITEQHKVSHHFRRLVSIESQFGTQDHHLNRYINLDGEDPYSTLPMYNLL